MAVFEVIIIITSAWLIILVSFKSKHKIFAKCLIIVALVLSSGIIYSNFFESPDSQSNTSSLGETVFTRKGQNDLINRLDWSPDGKRITSYSADGTKQTWDATTGNNHDNRRYYDQTLGAQITEVPSPDGKLVASLAMLPPLQPNNGLVIFPKGFIRVFDTATGRDILPQDWNLFGWVNQLAWSPQASSNDELIAYSVGGDIFVSNATTGKNVRLYEGNNSHCCEVDDFVYGLAWSPDGRYIASSGMNGDMQIWEIATGKLYNTYHVNCPTSTEVAIDYIAWQEDVSGSSRIVIGCYFKVFIKILSLDISYIYNNQTVPTTPTFSLKEEASISLCQGDEGLWSISPDDRFIAYSCSNSSVISIWNIVSKKNVLTYRNQNDVVTALVWSPNGQYIASGGQHGIVQVWRAA